MVNEQQDALYDYLNHIEHWEQWTIWTPDSQSGFQFHYEGPPSGKGATQCWKAKGKYGKTRICGGERPNHIQYLFSFGQGQHQMQGKIELKPRGSETEVCWSAFGDAGNSPARRIMAKMMVPYMRKDFERGLLKLQSLFA